MDEETDTDAEHAPLVEPDADHYTTPQHTKLNDAIAHVLAVDESPAEPVLSQAQKTSMLMNVLWCGVCYMLVFGSCNTGIGVESAVFVNQLNDPHLSFLSLVVVYVFE
jgi:hypothetical protein